MGKVLIQREECRNIQLQILTAIDRLCEEHGLTYYLAGGTLLGAIRHKGFIPWDDDIDILLFREDYDRLIYILKEQRTYEWLTVIDDNTDNYFYPFAKAVNNRTIAKMEDNKTKHGIWVDIMALETVPQNACTRRFYLHCCFMLRAIILSMTTDFKGLSLWNKKVMLKRFLDIMASCIGRRRIYQRCKKFLTKYNGTYSEYVCCTFSAYVEREYMLRKEFKPVIKLSFEGKYFNAPKAWDMYLRKLYSAAYMKLPPVEKRKTHSITAWWKNETLTM